MSASLRGCRARGARRGKREAFRCSRRPMPPSAEGLAVAIAARATIAFASVRRALVVLAPWRGNTRHGSPDRRRVVIAGEVTQRNDADQPLVAIDDRQAPDLGLAHVARHIVDFIGVEAVEHFLAHDIGDLGVRRLALSYRADDDIAVGDDADQPIVVADRQRTGVDRGHETCRLADGLIGAQQAHIASHYLANFHWAASIAMTW